MSCVLQQSRWQLWCESRHDPGSCCLPENTLNLALGTAKRIWTARHTENVLLRVQDARETLQLANSYMGELGKGIHELTTIKL
ncbi:MAG: DUF932 domain-containing protein, partial [Dorea sp.]